jgi:uncharacterized protein YceK
MSKIAAIGLAVTLATASGGCQALWSREKTHYAGSRADFRMAVEGFGYPLGLTGPPDPKFTQYSVPLGCLALVDLPLSLVVDTILLPIPLSAALTNSGSGTATEETQTSPPTSSEPGADPPPARRQEPQD